MKKLFIVCCLLLTVLSGCSSAQTPADDKVLTVLAPKGAPTIGILGYVKDNAAQVTTVDGSDLMQAAFVNPDPQYDVIVAPVNLGTKLISAGKSDYKLAAVVSWGNLYILSTDEQLKGDAALAAFGQGAVPEKVLDTVKDTLGFTGEITWYSAVSEVAGQLIAGKATTGLVAEPVMSKVMATAAAKGVTYNVVADLQQAWKQATGFDNYPQAAIFVRQEDYDAHSTVYNSFFSTVDSYLASSSSIVDDIASLNSADATADLVGVDASIFTENTIKNMNLDFVFAADSQDQILEFVKLFGVTSLDGVLLTTK